MDADQLFLRLQEETQNDTLQQYRETLIVTDDIFLSLVDRCLREDDLDIFEAVLEAKWRDPVNLHDCSCLTVQSVTAVLEYGREAWIERISEVFSSNDFLNCVVVGMWESKKFQLLESFARKPVMVAVFTYSTFQQLLLLSLQDNQPDEYVCCFDKLLFKTTFRDIKLILPDKGERFTCSSHTLGQWIDCCRKHSFGCAAVYTLLLVQDLTGTFNFIQEIYFTETSDQDKLNFLTGLCLYAGVSWGTAYLITGLAELYQSHERLDNLFHLLEDMLIYHYEWESLSHLTTWCSRRGLRQFVLLMYIRANDWMKLEQIITLYRCADLRRYVLMKISYTKLIYLWFHGNPGFVMELIAQSSQKAVILGHVLLRAVLNNDLVRIQQALSALPDSYVTRLFGDLDPDFMWPLLTGRVAVDDGGQQQFYFLACDMVILLIRSGLLHQLRSWLINSQFPECGSRREHMCQHCRLSFRRDDNNMLPNNTAVRLLLLSAFTPNRLLFQLRPYAASFQTEGRTEIAGMLEAFVNSPASLQTLAIVKVSICIGCHIGRRNRIAELQIPKAFRQRLAFEKGEFQLFNEPL